MVGAVGLQNPEHARPPDPKLSRNLIAGPPRCLEPPHVVRLGPCSRLPAFALDLVDPLGVPLATDAVVDATQSH
jgi:hypothetical protein